MNVGAGVMRASMVESRKQVVMRLVGRANVRAYGCVSASVMGVES